MNHSFTSCPVVDYVEWVPIYRLEEEPVSERSSVVCICVLVPWATFSTRPPLDPTSIERLYLNYTSTPSPLLRYPHWKYRGVYLQVHLPGRKSCPRQSESNLALIRRLPALSDSSYPPVSSRRNDPRPPSPFIPDAFGFGVYINCIIEV